MSESLDGQVAEFVQRVVGAMGLDLEVAFEERDDNVRLNLTGDGADALLKRKGEALDALQQIVNTGFRRELDDDRSFVVDFMGYRRGKDDELKQIARFTMEKAKLAGPQEMGPLNPYSRRLVHLTVAEDPTMSSESIGDAFLKTVIISKK